MNHAMPVRPTAVEIVLNRINALNPLDAIEQHHLEETRQWIQSGVPIFRIQKPDIPNKHLVAYFVLFDEQAQKILLVDHKKAQRWLPAGGHVEIDEDPTHTVTRECLEELGVQAVFWHEGPLFLSSTMTVGLTAGHTDVSLWYVLKGNHTESYAFDRGEFQAIRWFSFEDIPFEKADPHLERFVRKLKRAL